MTDFVHIFLHYLIEIAPALAIGFLISGFVHEIIPEDIVLKYLGNRGIKPILYSTFIGALLPVCCLGSLPIAVSFYKKGARLGPVLAFLVATPATSISAFLVAYAILGPIFAIYIFFAVIVMGLFVGLLGNMINVEPKHRGEEIICQHCKTDPEHAATHKAKTLNDRAISVLKYAFFELPKEIGLELLVGLFLAAAVATFVPIGNLVKIYLGGWFGYVFSAVFGIMTYLCSTASVPLIDSLIKQGMLPGAAMTLLLIGPVTSYGTILVLKKEYGLKVLVVFLAGLAAASVLLGLGFGFFRTF